jgi:hypothetical protein
MAGMHTKLSETFAYAMRIIYWYCIDALGEKKKKKKIIELTCLLIVTITC